MNRPHELSRRKFDDADLLIYAIVGGFLVLSIIYFIIISRFSGSAQWILVLILITFTAMFALLIIKKKLRRTQLARVPPAKKGSYKNELSDLRAALERADEGLRYSQLIVKEKFLQVLFEKVRVENNLSSEEMKILRNKEELKRYIKDQNLYEFAVSCIEDLRDWRVSMTKKPDRDFLNKINNLMARMEV